MKIFLPKSNSILRLFPIILTIFGIFWNRMIVYQVSANLIRKWRIFPLNRFIPKRATIRTCYAKIISITSSFMGKNCAKIKNSNIWSIFSVLNCFTFKYKYFISRPCKFYVKRRNSALVATIFPCFRFFSFVKKGDVHNNKIC